MNTYSKFTQPVC